MVYHVGKSNYRWAVVHYESGGLAEAQGRAKLSSGFSSEGVYAVHPKGSQCLPLRRKALVSWRLTNGSKKIVMARAIIFFVNRAIKYIL